MTPLRKARKEKKWTLDDVVYRMSCIGVRTDTGNLSRLERGSQGVSTQFAEALVQVFGHKYLTEMQILYPERYMDDEAA